MWAVFVLALMGGLLGLGLAYAADLLKVEADPRIEGVRERLPNPATTLITTPSSIT